MKTLKLKHSIPGIGQYSPQQDGAKLGFQGSCITIAVHGLPDDATYADAIAIASRTTNPFWLHEINADQVGKNLYAVVNLTEEQWESAPDWFKEKALIRRQTA